MKRIVVLIVVQLLFFGCGGSKGSGNFDTGPGGGIGEGDNENWLIPINEIKDGGPGKDGIPSIDNPKFLELNDPRLDFMQDDDLIVGMSNGNELKAYPHFILDYHEIVNDLHGENKTTISYCPLTGTAFGWKSVANNKYTTYGVSGLLYNANLILYDRLTDSKWSQLKLQCINGSQMGDEPETVSMIETTWATWRAMFPDTKVLSLDTGYSKPYGIYPYGPYKTDDSYFIFQASPRNAALPNKLRVHAIIDDKESKVYQFEQFKEGKVIKDSFKGKNVLVAGKWDLLVSFVLESDYDELEFTYAYDNGAVLFTDNEGNEWNALGIAISGPRMGESLKPTVSVISYWFAIAAFYPDPVIY